MTEFRSNAHVEQQHASSIEAGLYSIVLLPGTIVSYDHDTVVVYI